MTLIACTINKKRPILLGDILITSVDPNGFEDIHFPTNAPHFQETFNSLSIPVNLKQKIYILNKNLCVAFVGNLSECIQLLKEMRLQFSLKDEEEITFEFVQTFINNYDFKSNFRKSGFLFILASKINNLVDFKVITSKKPLVGWKETSMPIFNECFFAGSGTEDFSNEMAVPTIENLTADIDELHDAISYNLAFLARIMAKEYITFKTINERWGAGFEFIFFNGKAFDRFQEYVFIVMRSDIDQSGEFVEPFPILIMHYSYKNEKSNSELIITTFHITNGETRISDGLVEHHATDMYCNTFNISPLDDGKSEYIQVPFINTKFKCNCLAIGYFLFDSTYEYYPSYFSFEQKYFVEYTSTDLYMSLDPTVFKGFQKNYAQKNDNNT